MSELRLVLIFIGLALILGLYLRARRSAALKKDVSPLKGARFEPRLGDTGWTVAGGNVTDDPEGEIVKPHAPVAEGAEAEFEAIVAPSDKPYEEAVSLESPEPAVSGQSHEQKVVALRVRARGEDSLEAYRVVDVLRSQGLEYGDFGIFHRLDRNRGETVFSVASLNEPGSFDLDALDDMGLRGVSLFMVLPGPEEGVSAFGDMLATARRVAEHLDADLLDSEGTSLSAQRASCLREEIVEFQHHGIGQHAGGI